MSQDLTSFAQVAVSLLVGAVVFVAVIHLLRGLLAPPEPRNPHAAEPQR